ncbi:MAG: hypothetical protein JSS99_13485 [Actinobacteria bacterium]|nr:hypothetical protein [Actinomycetota bacterium]
MPATRTNGAGSDAPKTGRAGRLARPRAVADGVRGTADRLAHAPRDLAHVQYELARGLVSSAVTVDVDVNVDVDVASPRQVPPGA